MKQLVDPLITQGHRVFIPYSGPAFETRNRTSKYGFNYTTSRNPIGSFQKWLHETAGPLGVLWTTQKDPEGEGINIYFYTASHALLCKLTWGGQ